jgi:hypothetical protein
VIRAEAEDRTRLTMRSDGTLALVAPTARWIRDLRLRHLFLDVFPYHGDAPVDDIRAIVRATVALAHTHGAYPLFVATNFYRPCLDVGGQKSWLVRTLFEEEGIPHVDVAIDDRMRINSPQGHPNAEGHKKYADAIEAALRAGW